MSFNFTQYKINKPMLLSLERSLGQRSPSKDFIYVKNLLQEKVPVEEKNIIKIYIFISNVDVEI